MSIIMGPIPPSADIGMIWSFTQLSWVLRQGDNVLTIKCSKTRGVRRKVEGFRLEPVGGNANFAKVTPTNV